MEVEAGRFVGALELKLAVHVCAVLGLMRELDVVLVAAIRVKVGLRLAQPVHRESLKRPVFRQLSATIYGFGPKKTKPGPAREL